jgi:cardiolipin synthase
MQRIARRRAALCAALAVGLLAAALAGCAVPDVDTSIERAGAAGAPQLHGASGPLGAEESAAILTRLGAGGDGAESQALAAHLAIEEAVAGNPLTADNRVHVLPNGAAAFREISALIRGARHSVNLEYYTIENVVLDDNLSLLELLLSKRRQGVAVNIIYDSYGSSDTPAAFFEQLRAAGVNLLPFHPIAPGNLRNFNNRDHRKILVVDGEIAILGGVNLSRSYESKAPFSGTREERDEDRETLGEALGLVTALPNFWLDTAVRIDGPVVAQVQTLFRDHWKSEDGPPLDETGFFPALQPQGREVVRVIGSTPDQEISRYYVTLVSAMRNAQSRVWVSAAYFVPTEAEKEALIAAARRGVDVRLLVPGESDSEKAIRVGETHYLDLLRAGVKIWQTRDVVLHSKCVMIDGAWTAIGSSNFDHRSVLFNDEVDAVILGRETAGELEQVFTETTNPALKLDAETWAETRPIGERVRGFFAGFWEKQL